MDALLMCGGRGTRLDVGAEKPLFEVGGRPMVDRVRDALVGSPVETVHAVCSPHAPATREQLAGNSDTDRIVDAPGGGYVTDLGYALERVDPPVLTVAADLPLLEAEVIERVLDAFAGASLTVCVPVSLKELLGVSVDATMEAEGRTVAPTGVNVVAEPERGTEDQCSDDETYLTDDVRLAVNVNRPGDAPVAERLLDGSGGDRP